LNLDQWKLCVELIEEEQTNTLSIVEALREFPKDIKSEPNTLSSSPQSISFEEVKPHYCSQLNCSTQGIISLSTSPVLPIPTVQAPIVINMVVNGMDAIFAAICEPLNLT
jgi:hypothetical protein